MDRLIEKITGAVKNPKILIAMGLTGILLICLPSFFGGKKKTETKDSGEISIEEYRAGLEKNVEEIVSSITGSKNVKVVITLESGIIYSYADTNEGTSSESKQSYITVKTADGGEQALLITTEMPQVRGVAVVCEGGDDEIINEKITNAVTAALNITSKRVYIAGGSFNEKR